MADFEAKLVLHLVYGNEESAAVAGHRQHGYANATVRDKQWFESKDAFMAVVCKAFEQFYEEMSSDRPVRPDDDPSPPDGKPTG